LSGRYKPLPSFAWWGWLTEAGAVDGVSISCCKFFEEFMGWKGINFEPSSKYYQQLIKKRPKSTNLNMGLSNKTEILIFKDVITPTGECSGNGSFKHTKEHLDELTYHKIISFKEYEVKTINYIDLIYKYNIQKIDLFCLDVEGFEIKVLDGMSKSKILPTILCIEYNHLGLRNIIDYVLELNIGYKFDFISFNNAYFSTNDIQKKEKWFGETHEEFSVENGKEKWVKFNFFQQEVPFL
jgi:FkbM family methyltransferase